MKQNHPRRVELEHHHAHTDISDRALQIATYAILALFVLMIAVAIFGMYLRH